MPRTRPASLVLLGTAGGSPPFHEDDRVHVSATLVQRAPMFPALAYRFDTDDGSVVFSGDIGPSENFVELARGAEVLVREVIDTEWAEQLLPPPRTPTQEGLFRYLVGANTAVEQLASVAWPPGWAPFRAGQWAAGAVAPRAGRFPRTLRRGP